MPSIIATGDILVRIAGVSGALAVALGAYGAHAMNGKPPETRTTFETGNRYHMIHSLALLAAPLTNKPRLVGGLLMAGMVLFSGTCYFKSLTGITTFNRLAPIGGMTLIAAWACMAL